MKNAVSGPVLALLVPNLALLLMETLTAPLLATPIVEAARELHTCESRLTLASREASQAWRDAGRQHPYDEAARLAYYRPFRLKEWEHQAKVDAASTAYLAAGGSLGEWYTPYNPPLPTA